jgi:hypothetical protein
MILRSRFGAQSARQGVENMWPGPGEERFPFTAQPPQASMDWSQLALCSDLTTRHPIPLGGLPPPRPCSRRPPRLLPRPPASLPRHWLHDLCPSPHGVINEGLMRFPMSTEKSMGLGARAATAQSRGGVGGRKGRRGICLKAPGTLPRRRIRAATQEVGSPRPWLRRLQVGFLSLSWDLHHPLPPHPERPRTADWTFPGSPSSHSLLQSGGSWVRRSKDWTGQSEWDDPKLFPLCHPNSGSAPTSFSLPHPWVQGSSQLKEGAQAWTKSETWIYSWLKEYSSCLGLPQPVALNKIPKFPCQCFAASLGAPVPWPRRFISFLISFRWLPLNAAHKPVWCLGLLLNWHRAKRRAKGGRVLVGSKCVRSSSFFLDPLMLTLTPSIGPLDNRW